jgi:5-methylcytosine-specific restriction enzyme B
MADSSEIRSHLIRDHVEPARARGDYTVTIRAGDVVREVSSGTAIPAVCGVLGSDTFEREARVQRLAIDGPVPGATTLFVYKLRP